MRVGKVATIALDRNNHAAVTFILQRGETVFGDTRASARYQNLLGQRYVALEPGEGNPAPLPDNGSIPLEQTEQSFDISGLLNGFQPPWPTCSPRSSRKSLPHRMPPPTLSPSCWPTAPDSTTPRWTHRTSSPT
ncbi:MULTISPECIES: MlaD family protein [Nocardia]|uniref:MlaD family protein n=1 Tax=Nocardia elegans TaxID=300029 RepID=A0ABW6TNR8_9NOCA|nr:MULTISPECIES: MlaD family protein [Nocardia]